VSSLRLLLLGGGGKSVHTGVHVRSGAPIHRTEQYASVWGLPLVIVSWEYGYLHHSTERARRVDAIPLTQ
jgi:hypothetical protein